MKNKKEINAGIIIIGNEVLSGRTKDINTSSIALWLNPLGIHVKEVRVIADDENTIIDTVNVFRKKFNYVFTTGGIGPTHDDITAESIAKAFNTEYGFHKEAFSILESYYKPGEFTEGRQKMAKMPTCASLILNPSSGAPGFYIDVLIEKDISPIHTELHHEERQIIQATNVIDTRANLLKATKILDTAAKDKYIFLRESYLQRRAKLVTDGKDVQDFEIDVLEINY